MDSEIFSINDPSPGIFSENTNIHHCPDIQRSDAVIPIVFSIFFATDVKIFIGHYIWRPTQQTHLNLGSSTPAKARNVVLGGSFVPEVCHLEQEHHEDALFLPCHE